MIGHGAWIACDSKCGRYFVTNNNAIATMKRAAAKSDWEMVEPGYHFCPPCKAKRLALIVKGLQVESLPNI